MKKKTILAISTMLFLCACSQETYYQVYDVHSPDVAMKNGVYAYDNSDCRITYNLWSDGGNASFLVQNKTEKNLYLVMPKSFFILNGVANDYYSETTYSRAVTNSAQLAESRRVSVGGFLSDGTAWYPTHIARVYGAQIGTSTTESVSTKEMPMVCVPPLSSKLVYGFNISDHVYKDCDNYKFNYPNSVSPTITYNETNTPVKFRNRIAYTFDEEGKDVKYIDHTFWMTTLRNYSEKGGLKKLRYQECESSFKKSVKQLNMSAPNKFYNSYVENPMAVKRSKKK